MKWASQRLANILVDPLAFHGVSLSSQRLWLAPLGRAKDAWDTKVRQTVCIFLNGLWQKNA